jgi:hypothetical protein
MTSREIADMVELRHDNVRRTIEMLANKAVIALPQLEEKATGGRPSMEYVFSGEQGKRDSIVVVAQLSPEFTARLVDRWQELEKQVDNPRLMAPASQAQATVEACLAVASLFGVPTHLAQTESVKLALKSTGVDFSPLLLHAPAQSNIREDEIMLEPTELGKCFGLSGKAMNAKLESLGLQVKSEMGWRPTPLGSPYAHTHHWSVGNKSGYNLKWNRSVVSRMLKN